MSAIEAPNGSRDTAAGTVDMHVVVQVIPHRARRGALIVADIEAAHHELNHLGVPVSGIWHGPPFTPEARQPGPDRAVTTR